MMTWNARDVAQWSLSSLSSTIRKRKKEGRKGEWGRGRERENKEQRNLLDSESLGIWDRMKLYTFTFLRGIRKRKNYRICVIGNTTWTSKFLFLVQKEYECMGCPGPHKRATGDFWILFLEEFPWNSSSLWSLKLSMFFLFCSLVPLGAW